MPLKKSLEGRLYRMTLRLTPELRQWLLSKSRREKRPVSVLIRYILRRAMRAEGGHA